MSTPINPSAVYPPGGNPNTNYGAWSAANPPPPSIPGGAPSPPGRLTRAWNRAPQPPGTANIAYRRSIPPILTNRGIVFNSWILAMIIVSFDEWHNLGILPRPARLWDTSLVFGLLAMLGFVDIMVPITNALSLGYVIVLLYQYYAGNLTPAGGPAPNGGTGSGSTFSPVTETPAQINNIVNSVVNGVTTQGANPTGGIPGQGTTPVG